VFHNPHRENLLQDTVSPDGTVRVIFVLGKTGSGRVEDGFSVMRLLCVRQQETDNKEVEILAKVCVCATAKCKHMT
jgi:hypothetical protein